MTNYFFVLGSEDQESLLVEKLLRAMTETRLIAGFGFAAKDGKRCSAENAYQATEVMVEYQSEKVGSQEVVYVYIECCLPVGEGEMKPIVLDHHRPGDPGFGKPASDSVSASSFGQVLSLFGKIPNIDFVQSYGEALSSLGCRNVGGSCDATCEIYNTPAPGGFVFESGAWWLGVGVHGIGGGACASTAFALPAGWVAKMAADHNLREALDGEVQGITLEDVLASLRLPDLLALNNASESLGRL